MKIKVNWPLKNFSQEFSTFSFYENFPEVKKSLHCGKFNKPIKSEDGFVVEADVEISFIDLRFDGNNEIQISVPGDTILFFVQEDLECTITEPDLNSDSFFFNSVATRANNILYAHLFYQHDDGSNSYISSICGRFNTFYDQIKTALTQRGFGTYGIAIVLQYDGSDKTFKEASYKLSKKHEKLNKMMNILIKSSNETVYRYKDKLFYVQDIRHSLRPIFKECSRLLQMNLSDEFNTLCRRIVANIMNGGLPLNLFDELQHLVGDENKWNHRSENFDSFTLNFELFNSPEKLINEELKVPIHNLKNHFLEDSVESQFRSMFWDQVFSILFYSFFSSNTLNYRLQSEWDTNALFKNLESRSVDYVALCKQDGALKIPIPLFLSEMGYATFGIGLFSHKDFTKLLAIMSQSCIKLAKHLERNYKKAEDAIVFGAWVGGPEIQFVTTKAIVTAAGDNDDSFQVHTHSSFPPEWKSSVLMGTNETETESQVVEAGANVAQNTFNSPDHPENTQTSSSEDIFYLDSEGEEENVPNYPEFDDINYDSLIKIKSFVGQIVDHFNYLNSAESNRDPGISERTFKCPDDKGFFQPARASSASKTPGKDGMKQSRENEEETFYPTSPTPGSRKLPSLMARTSLSYCTSRRSIPEVQLYRKFLCHVPEYFPEVSAFAKDQESGKYEISMEFMDYFVDPETGNVSERLWFSRLGDGLTKALTVSLQLLNSLDWLHRIFNTVHADISPYNIMFSERYDTWKFIDFEHSMDINMSLNTKRICGTIGYIAAESQESGIFDEASDVFALGTVFVNFLWTPILYRLGNRSSVPKPLETLIFEFERIVFQMTTPNPKQRPSAYDSMMAIFEIIRKLPQNRFDYGHPALERVNALFEEKKQLESVSAGIENISIESTLEAETEQAKRTKLEERSDEKLDILS